jgi:hypothetical protein
MAVAIAVAAEASAFNSAAGICDWVVQVSAAYARGSARRPAHAIAPNHFIARFLSGLLILSIRSIFTVLTKHPHLIHAAIHAAIQARSHTPQFSTSSLLQAARYNPRLRLTGSVYQGLD